MYTVAVLEYMAAKVLELAGNRARDLEHSSIQPEDIQHAIAQDPCLSELCAQIGFAIPHDELVTLPRALVEHQPLQLHLIT